MLTTDRARPDLRIIAGLDIDEAERERRRIRAETMDELASLVERRAAEIRDAGFNDARERDVAAWMIETATRTLDRANRAAGINARVSLHRIADRHEDYAKALRHHAEQ